MKNVDSVKSSNDEDYGRSDWDDLAKDESYVEEVDIEQSLADGRDPEELLSNLYSEGVLEKYMVEDNEGALTAAGMREDRIEYWENKASGLDSDVDEEEKIDVA